MSRENVQLVREASEHYARGDLEGVLAFYAPDIEWDMSGTGIWTDGQLYHGVDAVRGFYEQWLSAWDDYEAWFDEVIDAGADVVVVGHQRGTAKDSGVPVEMPFAQVVSVIDGRVTRVRTYLSREEALEAVAPE